MALAPYVNPIGQLHTTSFLSIPGPNPHVYDTIFRQAYQKRVENADSAIDAQLERMTRPRQPKQPGKNRKK